MLPAQWQTAERFLEHLRLERRLSEHTARAYRRDLGCLAEICDKNGIGSFTELKSHQLRRFAAVSHAGGLAPRSIQRRLSGVRSFMKYLIREGALKSNPGADIAVKQLMNKPPTANSKGLRFGNYVQGREVIEEEMEAVIMGKKDAKSAMDEAVRRGNDILRKFQAANKG